MTLVRTATAHCDREGCTSTLEIDPYSTQSWLAVTDKGWTLENDLEGDTIRTFCPRDHDAPESWCVADFMGDLWAYNPEKDWWEPVVIAGQSLAIGDPDYKGRAPRGRRAARRQASSFYHGFDAWERV